jgi:hypothetical protein
MTKYEGTNPAIVEANERANRTLYIPRYLREPSGQSEQPKQQQASGSQQAADEARIIRR